MGVIHDCVTESSAIVENMVAFKLAQLLPK